MQTKPTFVVGEFSQEYFTALEPERSHTAHWTNPPDALAILCLQ